jgi:phosphohistidine phosphatase
MKTVILVRHAKSSWKESSLKDFDRPLNKRGKRDAPFMGKKLKERQVMPDLILSSPAKRAKETATCFAKEIGYPGNRILYNDKMYHSGGRVLLEIVRNQDDVHGTIMLFGHNPDLGDLAEMLLNGDPVYTIPTTGVYCIRFAAASWKNIREGKGEVVFFDYPKRYRFDET